MYLSCSKWGEKIQIKVFHYISLLQLKKKKKYIYHSGVFQAVFEPKIVGEFN